MSFSKSLIQSAAVPLLAFACLMGCGGGGGSIPSTPSGMEYYLAGSAGPADTMQAVVWRNGLPAILTDGTHGAEAIQVATAGNRVYAVGYEGNGTKDVATLWTYDTTKNFQAKAFPASRITDGTNHAYANAILVDGDTLFVSGSEYVDGVSIAKVWRHSVDLTTGAFEALTLPQVGTGDAQAYNLTISGTTLYILGNGSNGTHTMATLWSYDTTQPFAAPAATSTVLTDGSQDGYANALAVHGATLLVAGMESNGTSTVAKLWQSSQTLPLAFSAAGHGGAATDFYSLAMDGDKAVLAGLESNGTNTVAKYWTVDLARVKGDFDLTDPSVQTVTMSDGLHNAWSHQAVVVDGKVYATLIDANGLKGAANVAGAWVDDAALAFSDGSVDNVAYSICTIRH